MRLDNEKLEVLLARYREGEREVIADIRKEIDLFVYNFPRVCYRDDSDVCGDFYLYVFERIERLLEEWDPQRRVPFASWFVLQLRYLYKGFRLIRKKEEFESLPEDYACPGFDDEESSWEKFRERLSVMKEPGRLWILWFYLPEELSPEDMLKTQRITGKSYLELLDIQREMIKVRLEDINNIREISEKLAKLFEAITELKWQIRSHPDEAAEKLSHLMRLENQRERLQHRLERPNNELLRVFSRLFRSLRDAKVHLRFAESQLKLLFVKEKGGEDHVLSPVST